MTNWRSSFTVYYEVASWFYLIAPLFVFPLTFFIVAPFGRFSSKESKFTLDGVIGWMLMEIVAPISFLTTYFLAPFSANGRPPPLVHPSTLLASLFVLHYLNRAIFSPLRAPGRSTIHIIVVFCGIVFNLVNPCLMAAFLSAPETCPRFLEAPSDNNLPSALQFLPIVYQPFIQAAKSFSNASPNLKGSWTSPTFVFGVILFSIGLLSNVLHDEILYDLRRNSPPTPNGKYEYAIPHGYLYDYISYPNYFSEWFEWIGFALAASPGWEYTPPWMFVIAEIMVMMPRAYKGHQWYRQKFPDYPKGRKAVIPFLF